MVTVVDLVGDNGVVHVIDRIIMVPVTSSNSVYDIISKLQVILHLIQLE